MGDRVPLAFHSGREADHSPPFSAEIKEWVELYLHSPIRFNGVVLRGSTGIKVNTGKTKNTNMTQN